VVFEKVDHMCEKFDVDFVVALALENRALAWMAVDCLLRVRESLGRRRDAEIELKVGKNQLQRSKPGIIQSPTLSEDIVEDVGSVFVPAKNE